MLLEIVTPDGRNEIRGVRSVVFQTPDGQTNILPGHVPLICQVAAGVLVASVEENTQRFATGTGVAHVDGSRVRLLLHELIAEKNIVPDAAWAALEAAEKSLALPDCASLPELRAQYLEQLQFAQAQIELRSSR
jgi:F-type H+-transporting ATPase subunit epsilon